ncbi:hypothetical protein FHW83_001339 [Duganella sp. SG902]|uniref:HvfC/BufC N-terminal domain-containing protein n=1 Tax=Duganella sp. SG902 TaxID=2587016 RepID=UPI00159E8096|nr:DNA-binding domain-containing protein [Duganella sp. SG902]NVM75552.1 hypothetical protein [Duganella sp. SG902]
MMLADLQRGFERWLVGAPPDAVLAGVGGGPRAMAGLAVYQNNYRAQLVGALEACYPKLRVWLGEEGFRHAAITHVDAHPPHAWTLDAYADGFARTLAALYPHNPDLHELAWIEHALGAAFVAADAPPDTQALAPEAMARLDWDTARLRLTPSLRTATALTNSEQVWSALWEARELPDSEMLAEQGGLLVWRRGYRSCLTQVDLLEYEALLQLQSDGGFAALCEWLAARCGEAAGVAKAGELLAAWLASELITDIERNTND